MNLGELGEFGAIARTVARLRTAATVPAGAIGMGDDTAAIPADGRTLLFTIDTMVEGIDFLADVPAECAGFKIVAVSLSDIAAMGGTPTAVVVSVACPRTTDVEWLDALNDGVAEASRCFDVPVLGGDMSVSPTIVLSTAVLGECDTPVLRSGARPGNLVCVTGSLGGATAGLRILGIERVLKKPEGDYGHAGLRLLDRHLKPEPRLAAGRALAAGEVTAMIDTSDGLMGDLGHICERSGVGITLDAELIPVDPDLAELAGRIVPDPLVTALTGGEDFELAVTLPSNAFEETAVAVEETGTTLTRIGVVEAEPADKAAPVRVIKDGLPMMIGKTGWAHFE